MSSATSKETRDESALISIIVPVFNEGDRLRATLESVRAQTVPFEVIVVDAGSSDDTVAVARAAGAAVIAGPCQQRAHQLNLGAKHANGDALLFLHADTLLPEGALDGLEHALRDRRVVGGAFVRRYASPSLLLQATCRLAHLRNRTIGWHLGDQAMFVRRSTFFQLGGFREVDSFEDLDFSRRLGSFGRLVTLSPAVTSSARRFTEAGTARRTWRDLALTARYLMGGLDAVQTTTVAKTVHMYEVRESVRHL